MKPPPFRYLAPTSLEEALAHLAEHGFEAKVLAGGQSLIPAMNFRLARPSILVDLNTVAGLGYITENDAGGVHIGAMTRQSTVEKSDMISKRTPLLAATMPQIAHIQIRNRGTIGGSLAHADPAAELPAVMVVLGANFLLASAGGQRWVQAEDFYQGLFTTDLAEDELLVEVVVPRLAEKTGCSIREVVRRHGDYAMAGIAARIALDDNDVCIEASIAFFGVGEGPVRSLRAEALMVGEHLTDELIQTAVAAAVRDDLDPHEDIHASPAYRAHLAKVIGFEAVTQARNRASGAAVPSL